MVCADAHDFEYEPFLIFKFSNYFQIFENAAQAAPSTPNSSLFTYFFVSSSRFCV